MARTKKQRLYKFAFETEHGYWNESKSYYESEEAFKLRHDMPTHTRMIKTGHIDVPEPTGEQKAYVQGLKDAAKKSKRPTRDAWNTYCPDEEYPFFDDQD